MGRMIDELKREIEAIEEEGDLIMKEEFIMGIFQEIMYELPPF